MSANGCIATQERIGNAFIPAACAIDMVAHLNASLGILGSWKLGIRLCAPQDAPGGITVDRERIALSAVCEEEAQLPNILHIWRR